MLITTVWKITAADSNLLYNIDVFISIIFGVGGGLTAQAMSLTTSSGGKRPTAITTYIAIVTQLGYSSLGIWYWFVGLYTLVSPDGQFLTAPYQHVSRSKRLALRSFFSFTSSICLDGSVLSARLAPQCPLSSHCATQSTEYGMVWSSCVPEALQSS